MVAEQRLEAERDRQRSRSASSALRSRFEWDKCRCRLTLLALPATPRTLHSGLEGPRLGRIQPVGARHDGEVLVGCVVRIDDAAATLLLDHVGASRGGHHRHQNPYLRIVRLKGSSHDSEVSSRVFVCIDVPLTASPLNPGPVITERSQNRPLSVAVLIRSRHQTEVLLDASMCVETPFRGHVPDGVHTLWRQTRALWVDGPAKPLRIKKLAPTGPRQFAAFSSPVGASFDTATIASPEGSKLPSTDTRSAEGSGPACLSDSSRECVSVPPRRVRCDRAARSPCR